MTANHHGAQSEPGALQRRPVERPNYLSSRWKERPNLAPGVRVLLAGDGKEHRTHLANAVERVGCELVEFNEWQELVQTLRDTPLPPAPGETDDIVVLDLRLSGRRLLDRVVAVVGDRVPLVLVTSEGQEIPPTAGWTVLQEPVQADDVCGAIVTCALENGRRGGKT